MSGRASASGMPGTPPPEPRSIGRRRRQWRRAAAGRPAQSSRCRRATSAGAGDAGQVQPAVGLQQQRRRRRRRARRSHRAGGRPVPAHRPAARLSARPTSRASAWAPSVWAKRKCLLRWRFGLPGQERLDGRLSHRPRASPVTVLGRRGSRISTLAARKRWTTRRLSTNPRSLPQNVDKSARYTRSRWRPNLSGPVRSRDSGGDAEQRLATALRPPERGRAGKDPRLLPGRNGATNPTPSRSPGTPPARSSSPFRRISICRRSTSTWS